MFLAKTKNMEAIESYIQRKILILHQSSTVQQAARAMTEKNVGCALICDAKGYLVGIATDRDLACSMGIASNTSEMPLSEVMTPRPVCVEESAEIDQVVRIMEESGVRRVPVVKRVTIGGSKCVGIVTLDDLIAFKLISYDQLARIIYSQFKKKWRIHPSTEHRPSSEQRAEARAEHTLNRFYKVIADALGLTSETSNRITNFLLECLIQRLHYTNAAHFIAQLPKDLQESLLDLPAGPDRNFTPEFMKLELSTRFGFSDLHSQAVLEGFFPLLQKLIDPAEVENIKAQLPDDFRSLFRGISPPETPKKETAA